MIVEVRPGEGGEDAERFADELFDVLMKCALMPNDGWPAGSVTFKGDRFRTGSREVRTIRFPGANSMIEGLAGTHRVQRIPKGSSARHTSTATVVVLDEEPVRSS